MTKLTIHPLGVVVSVKGETREAERSVSERVLRALVIPPQEKKCDPYGDFVRRLARRGHSSNQVRLLCSLVDPMGPVWVSWKSLVQMVGGTHQLGGTRGSIIKNALASNLPSPRELLQEKVLSRGECFVRLNPDHFLSVVEAVKAFNAKWPGSFK